MIAVPSVTAHKLMRYASCLTGVCSLCCCGATDGAGGTSNSGGTTGSGDQSSGGSAVGGTSATGGISAIGGTSATGGTAGGPTGGSTTGPRQGLGEDAYDGIPCCVGLVPLWFGHGMWYCRLPSDYTILCSFDGACNYFLPEDCVAPYVPGC